ncbi:hypothetical protein GEMRC1_000040 [Eukaryota sp. GEM-RC1]
MQVSEDRKRVVYGSLDFGGARHILGENPLLPRNDYTWKLRYQGDTNGPWVGVIDESKFNVEGGCRVDTYCIANAGFVSGGLSGYKAKWNPGELLEINVNLTDFTITIKSVSNSTFLLTGTLPRLRCGNYYLYALLSYSDHELEIVE